MTPKVFQQRARDCLNRARMCSDPVHREALRELAAGFARSAFELATCQENARYGHRSTSRRRGQTSGTERVTRRRQYRSVRPTRSP
jgi:hypothetical protein